MRSDKMIKMTNCIINPVRDFSLVEKMCYKHKWHAVGMQHNIYVSEVFSVQLCELCASVLKKINLAQRHRVHRGSQRFLYMH